MAAPVSITCPICRNSFPVPTEVVAVEDPAHVLVRMDRSDLYGHLQQCAAGHAHAQPETPTPPPAAPPAAPYVARGTRPCTMCGTHATNCLGQLHATQGPCCAACGHGNTHPAPQDSLPCATWAAEHGVRR